MLGLGAVTGLVGYVGGVIWGFLSVATWTLLLRDPEVWTILTENAGYIVSSSLWYGFTWAIPAALIGTTFGGVLSLSEGQRRLSELRLWKMSAMGALIGAAVPIVSTLHMGGFAMLAATAGVVVGDAAFLAAIGGTLAGGMVAVAKREERRELAVVEEVAALAAAPQD